jgi:acetylornithine deacetylase/succinyl-diaminopimelate desuccinylase-like protein
MVRILSANSVTSVTFFLSLCVLACAGPQPPSARIGAGLGARAAALLSESIRIRTVSPPGDERPLAELLVRRLEEAGLEAEVIPTPKGVSKTGRAAAWGVLPGRGKRSPIVLLSHLDVVPAERADWTFDPFAGRLEQGYVVGRGALDAKGVAVVHLLTVTELARRGTRLQRDVVFLATPDEETGGVDGAGYLAARRRELLRGAGYLLTEGGGILTGDGRHPTWGVGVTEKAPCWLRITSTGTPGHGAVPSRDGAVPRLIAGLERVRRLETPVRVVPEVGAMFHTLASRAPAEDRLGYQDLGFALQSDDDFRLRFLSQPGNAALVRDTVSINVLKASGATNVIPAVATAQLDARLLPGESCESFLKLIERTLADPRLAVDPMLAFDNRSSSADTPLYRAIQRVAEATDPQALVVPRVNAGFSDAHYFRELGLTAYGFVPRWLHPDEARGIHGPDERISIENLERGVETMIEILEELDRQEEPASPPPPHASLGSGS